MAEYLAEVPRMEKFIDGFEVRYVPRLDNRDADHLTWIAYSRAPTPPDIIIEKLSKPLVRPAVIWVCDSSPLPKKSPPKKSPPNMITLAWKAHVEPSPIATLVSSSFPQPPSAFLLPPSA
jgi:hypothetical protein